MGDLHRLIEAKGYDVARAECESEEDRRRVDWAHDIMSRERLRRGYLHSGFCLVALPHKKPKNDTATHTVTNGAFRLILTPKPIDTDEEGNAIFAGLPYGPKSRLILMYLQSYAVRHRTKTIVLGDSMTEWIRRLGFENPSGGERGVITAINEQARRISRCDFTLIWDRGATRKIQDQAIVKGLETFAYGGGEDDDDRQLTFLSPADGEAPARRRRKYSWVKEIELSDEFYTHLQEHKVVLAEDAIAKLKASSWALDVYLWLCYRLRSVEKVTEPLSWEALRLQFSPTLYKGNLTTFRTAVMIPALKDVLAVYPEARVSWDERGVVLAPSGLPVPDNRVHQVLLPKVG